MSDALVMMVILYIFRVGWVLRAGNRVLHKIKRDLHAIPIDSPTLDDDLAAINRRMAEFAAVSVWLMAFDLRRWSVLRLYGVKL